MRDKVLAAIPYPVRIIVGLLAHRKNMQTLHGQGTGRFSGAEIALFRNDVWENLDNLLVESKRKQAIKKQELNEPFWAMGGDGPTEADTVLFGFIVGALVCDA
jgi:hypothetical protein